MADKAAGGGKEAALQGPANKLTQQVPPPLQLPCWRVGRPPAYLMLCTRRQHCGGKSQCVAPH